MQSLFNLKSHECRDPLVILQATLLYLNYKLTLHWELIKNLFPYVGVKMRYLNITLFNFFTKSYILILKTK